MREADRNGNPLAIDPEAMRAYGYRTVDMLVQRLSDASVAPLTRASPDEMRERLSGPPPAAGEDFEAILERLERDVLPFTSRGDHPGFLAFIPSCGTWPGALGDFIASTCNIYAGSRMESDPARARGARLVCAVDRLPRRRRRCARRGAGYAEKSGSVSEPSCWSVNPGLCAISQACPSGSVKTPA